jgi:hypothetical protein
MLVKSVFPARHGIYWHSFGQKNKNFKKIFLLLSKSGHTLKRFFAMQLLFSASVGLGGKILKKKSFNYFKF